MRGASPVSLEIDSRDVSLSFWDIEITTLERKSLTVPVRPVYVTYYYVICDLWVVGYGLYGDLHKEIILCSLRLSAS